MPQPALPSLAFTSPLVSTEVVATALGKTHKAILKLVARREFGIAFDFGIESRSLVRVLAQEVQNFQTRQGRKIDLETAINNIIFPDVLPTRVGVVRKVRACVVAHRFSVSGDHTARLIREGWLELVRGETFRRGRKGSPFVTFASITAYLKGARIA